MNGSPIELTHVLASKLAMNKGPSARKIGERVQPKYDSSLVYHRGEFIATLRFLTGESYCCMERSCHIGIPGGKLWEALRVELTLNNEDVPSQFLLKMITEVEEGARFFDFERPIMNHRGWYRFGAIAATTYEERFTDGVLESDT